VDRMENQHPVISTSIKEGERYSSDLALAGEIADSYARDQVFLAYHSKKSSNTQLRQQQDLALFCSYLAEAHVQREATSLYTDPHAWSGITAGLIEGFIRWQLSRGYAISSINTHLSTIKIHCRLARRAGTLLPAPLQEILLISGYSHREGRNADRERAQKRLGSKKAETTILNAGHIALLKQQPATPIGRRDAFLMYLFLELGLRVSEVCALRVDQIDLAVGTITFYREKVDLEQTHQFSDQALIALMAYLPHLAQSGSVYLFPGYKGGSMQVRAINKRVGILGKRIGVLHLSPHDLRHCWATLALKHQTNIDRLQDAGGWSSPAMPLRYANKARIANEGVKLS
ncbi:MAG TPA: tyrosine-type recombinase/integrase, partial [Ktedonobacteraceae bacterium]|nr:tyrosine-type recombinase/integrase [Ktedonobacteraceae bacterium]